MKQYLKKVKGESSQIDQRFKLKFFLLLTGLIIIGLTTSGYSMLFSSSTFDLLGFDVSPVAILMAVLELACLALFGLTLGAWFRQPLLIKGIFFVVALLFWTLSYAGLSSYMWGQFSNQYQQTRTDEVRYEISQDRSAQLGTRLVDLRDQTALAQAQLEQVDRRVEMLNGQLTDATRRKSERRKIVSDCTRNADCSAAVRDLERSALGIEADLDSAKQDRARIKDQLQQLSRQKQELQSAIIRLESDTSDLGMEVGARNAEVANKVAGYERFVESVAGLFGVKVENPFRTFVDGIALAIYPCFILLTVAHGAESRGNRLARRARKQKRARKKQKKQPINKPLIIPVPADATEEELRLAGLTPEDIPRPEEPEKHKSAEHTLEKVNPTKGNVQEINSTSQADSRRGVNEHEAAA